MDYPTRAAAQFPHAIYGIVANAGHTPDLHPCGVAMAIDFVEHLTTNPNRCRHAGWPPDVVPRPGVNAAQLQLPRLNAPLSVRRAIAVVLATLADERAAAASGMTGVIDALRGGTYIVGRNRVRFIAARVVTDAVVNGTLEIGARGARARLSLRGPGAPPPQLTLRATARTISISGIVGSRHVNVQLPTSALA